MSFVFPFPCGETSNGFSLFMSSTGQQVLPVDHWSCLLFVPFFSRKGLHSFFFTFSEPVSDAWLGLVLSPFSGLFSSSLGPQSSLLGLSCTFFFPVRCLFLSFCGFSFPLRDAKDSPFPVLFKPDSRWGKILLAYRAQSPLLPFSSIPPMGWGFIGAPWQPQPAQPSLGLDEPSCA